MLLKVSKPQGRRFFKLGPIKNLGALWREAFLGPQGPTGPTSSSARGMMTFILGGLAACSSWVPAATTSAPELPAIETAVPLMAPAASAPSAPSDELSPAPWAPEARLTAPSSMAILRRAKSRWVPVQWSDLPGWQRDRTLELWPALLHSCTKATPPWRELCLAAQALPPQSDDETRLWLQTHLQPYRIEALNGKAEGLITGYFEPLVTARREPDADFNVPLYALPLDLSQNKPYWSRKQMSTVPAARASLRGREIAFVQDPLDALILQIQGSGRLQLTEPDGQGKWVRVAFAGHNNHPYQSVGRWLIDRGELSAAQASWPGIKAWAQKNPRRLQEMLWANPRVVFFREEPLPDPPTGPLGAQAVPLTPERSVAVDPQSIPYGTPLWLETTEPLSRTPLQRVVMAQDTGSAITGAVRADFFWGTGEHAEQQAGRMKQALRLWALWPRNPHPPTMLTAE